MQEFAALTRNSFGRGWGYFLGTVAAEPGFYDLLIADILQHASLKSYTGLPQGVEVSLRMGEDKQLLFIINHTEESQTVPVPKGKLDLLTGSTTNETITLDRFGVAVIQL